MHYEFNLVSGRPEPEVWRPTMAGLAIAAAPLYGLLASPRAGMKAARYRAAVPELHLTVGDLGRRDDHRDGREHECRQRGTHTSRQPATVMVIGFPVSLG